MKRLHLKDAIPEETELKCARVLVQACEPIVMQMALAERVEIFVSFSHSIGDLMPVHFWETHGLNSGMQSLSGDGKAVYVSCGGNPFFDGKDDQKRYTTDGLPALARMMVIAGQELGHYADILRNHQGQTISRHSAQLAPLRAKDNVYEAWQSDQATCAALEAALARSPLHKAIRRAEAVAFFHERKRWAKWLFACTRRALANRALTAYGARHTLPFLTRFPSTLLGGKSFADNIALAARDFRDNLTPLADVYMRDDKVEEEAIACIEALARVPQQVNKWGHEITQIAWPQLYPIYYAQVIPENQAAYERLQNS